MANETGIPAGALDRRRGFDGAKTLLFVGEALAVLQRDDLPTIPFPGLWDMPGGGREPGESPLDCVIRETAEELSLQLVPADFHYARPYRDSSGVEVWFFAARIPAGRQAGIRLGSEGQGWALMASEEYLAHPLRIPPLAARLRDYLAAGPKDESGSAWSFGAP
ncbi:NUDIX domain-containing protein [Oceanicola sp. S124]|uniref:NUDIX domain-containing protein n=1 Tax=Oceanicola sp. S124 TaxID=1042378 RepID=UPI00025590CD|nr:NUDIX hydrolase [Oceanicola sp. S124]